MDIFFYSTVEMYDALSRGETLSASHKDYLKISFGSTLSDLTEAVDDLSLRVKGRSTVDLH